MQRNAKLDLKKEVLGELSTTELASIVGGPDTITPRTVTGVVTTTAPTGDVQCYSCCSCTAMSNTVER